jgi:hypothetical protein
MSYTDKMTLDEIQDNDLEMVKYAVKNANKHQLRNQRQAAQFVKHCLDITLKRLGVHVNPPRGQLERARYAKILDQQMEEKKVRIENRNKYTDNESWRNGIYIFKNDELTTFISDILTVRRQEYSKDTLRLHKQSIGCFVVTNAKIDRGQNIFISPGIVSPYSIGNS